MLIIAATILLGIISGIYPAFYMNSFNPVNILKGVKIKGRKSLIFRKCLTIFQFAISIVLIISALFIFKQLRFISQKDLGFDKDSIVTLRTNRELASHFNAFKTELLKYEEIESVACSWFNPGELWAGWGGMEINGKFCPHDVTYIDPDYFKTFDLEVITGRNFSWDRHTDKTGSYILNETSVKKYNLDKPVGSLIDITGNGSKGTIIGVVKDYHYKSLHKSIAPALFCWDSSVFRNVNIRISSKDIKSALNNIKTTWNRICPGFPFHYTFFDQTLNALYRKEQILSSLFIYFSMIAIIIACLGIFGLSASTAEQKTKEIGIRKVLGSSITKIIILLVKDIGWCVCFANLLAWPAAYYISHRWLQNFAYRIDIRIDLFLLVGMAALIIALISVSFQAIRSALANPVDSLKYE